MAFQLYASRSPSRRFHLSYALPLGSTVRGEKQPDPTPTRMATSPMKSITTKISGWVSILLGVLIIVFSDYLHGHWPVTGFLPDAPSHLERTIWATHSTIAISITGIVTCSVGMWLLSCWPHLHRAYWIIFIASPIFVWGFIWWILGGWDVIMTHGTTGSWWLLDCIAAAFLILALFIPARGRQIAFGIASVFYLVVCMLLLAFSLWTQTGRWGPAPSNSDRASGHYCFSGERCSFF